MSENASGLIAHGHAEFFHSRRTGDLILVRCYCTVGRDHTYIPPGSPVLRPNPRRGRSERVDR